MLPGLVPRLLSGKKSGNETKCSPPSSFHSPCAYMYCVNVCGYMYGVYCCVQCVCVMCTCVHTCVMCITVCVRDGICFDL